MSSSSDVTIADCFESARNAAANLRRLAPPGEPGSPKERARARPAAGEPGGGAVDGRALADRSSDEPPRLRARCDAPSRSSMARRGDARSSSSTWSFFFGSCFASLANFMRWILSMKPIFSSWSDACLTISLRLRRTPTSNSLRELSRSSVMTVLSDWTYSSCASSSASASSSSTASAEARDQELSSNSRPLAALASFSFW